jgi:RNA polymerase sigma-70 factor (ECF subfamily)
MQLAESSELIARAQQGDGAAFGELSRRFHPRAYQTALRILKNSEDAEDAVQESMINAYRHIGNFRGDSAFATWLTRIVMNMSLMQLRKRNRRNNVSLEEPMGEDISLSELLASESPSPEGVLLEKQRVTLLWRWLGELPASLRDITVERMREDLSVDELAARRGISVAAAKSRLLRARHAIMDRAAAGSRTALGYPNVYSA